MFILGPNNCGKSLYAEEMLNGQYIAKGYFATLPDKSQFQRKISEHAIRRDEQWNVYEAKYDMSKDMEKLKHLLEDNDVTLIDGLAVYVMSLFKFSRADTNYNLAVYFDFINAFEGLLSDHRNKWVIVDSIAWQRHQNSELVTCMELLHDIVKNNVLSDENVILLGQGND